jgi:uncharacterized caspase-like protein
MLHAVLVGIDRYTDPDIRALRYARADAEALGKLFEERIHPAERRVRLLLDENATKSNVMVAIGDTLPKVVTKDDVVVLFFAGHGSPETTSSVLDASRYLVMHDTRYGSLFGTAIDMERELRALMERLDKPKLVLLIVDACFSGRSGGRTFEGPRLRQVRADRRGAAFSLVSLEALNLGQARGIMTACNDDQVARESSDCGHGIFTDEFLKRLTQPRGATTVSVLTLWQEVADGVSLRTDGQQIPIVNGRFEGARFPSLGEP